MTYFAWWQSFRKQGVSGLISTTATHAHSFYYFSVCRWLVYHYTSSPSHGTYIDHHIRLYNGFQFQFASFRDLFFLFVCSYIYIYTHVQYIKHIKYVRIKTLLGWRHLTGWKAGKPRVPEAKWLVFRQEELVLFQSGSWLPRFELGGTYDDVGG